MTELVQLERPREGVALLTVTNPAIHNCSSFAGVSQLADALQRAREGGARIAVLASGVEGHWLEHAWLPDLAGMVKGEPTSGDAMGWFNALAQITSDDCITLAAISGDCSGGGAELAWACDLRIAEEQARFAQPEVRMGLSTGIGGASRLMRLVGRTLTAEMVLDGTPVGAPRLHALGALNRLVPTGRAVAESLEWASQLAERPAAALRVLKKTLKDAEDLPLSEALANEQTLFQSLLQSPEGLEGMRQIQKRIEAGESLREIYGAPRS